MENRKDWFVSTFTNKEKRIYIKNKELLNQDILNELILLTPNCSSSNCVERLYWLCHNMQDYYKCKCS